MGMQSTPSVSMHCDCQAVISLSKNKALNGKNKHIHLRHEFVKQLLKDGIIFIDYVKSEVIFETSSGMGLRPIRY